jgi:membrane-associated phospholipid phosphatase
MRKIKKRSFYDRVWNSGNNRKIIIACGIITLLLFCLKIFIEVTESLLENELNIFDSRVSNYIFSFSKKSLTEFFLFVTTFGDKVVYIPVSLTIFTWMVIRKKRLLPAVSLILITLSGYILNSVLKGLFERKRPVSLYAAEINSSSYPSGHAFTGILFYGCLIWLIAGSGFPLLIRYFLVCILSVLIILIGISRIYLKAHYPSDVIAGWAFGMIWLVLGLLVYRSYETNRRYRR